MIRSTLAAAVALAAIIGTAHADDGGKIRSFVTGNQLATICRDPVQVNPYNTGYCTGYIAAQADSIAAVAQAVGQDIACIPDEVTQGQARDIVVRYLTKHPEHRHYAATSQAVLALREAFPCKPAKVAGGTQ